MIFLPNYNKSWALIIGINKYKYAGPLKYAVNDAKEIAKILEKEYNFPKANISLLIDEQATFRNIRKSYAAFIDKGEINPDDRIVVFFAGHGTTVEGKRGEVGFLIPVDGKVQDTTTLIEWHELTRNADLIPAKHIFFLMDACYGGTVFQRSPSFGHRRFLGNMLERYARQALTAGKADETVSDGNGVRPGHSIFTAHLLDALDGAAATDEGIITANGIMAYVYNRVASDQLSHQTPHYGYLDGDGDFIFDTSLLESIQSNSQNSESKDDKKKGDDDILVSTSPAIKAQIEPENPLINTLKEFLSDNSKKIALEDFVINQVRSFLEETNLGKFPVQTSTINNEDFAQRLKNYEDLIIDLQTIVILLAKYGNFEQLALLKRVLILLAESDKGSAGAVLWLNLGWYPILLLMYSAGISALAAEKYEVLKIIFETLVHKTTTSEERNPLIEIVTHKMGEISNSFTTLSQEKYYVPRSEHLYKVLQPTIEDILILGRDYERLFDLFEMLFALVYANTTQGNWGPPGRFAWKHSNRRSDGLSPYDSVIEEAKKHGTNWGPIKEGLFEGSLEKFARTSQAYKETLDKLGWW